MNKKIIASLSLTDLELLDQVNQRYERAEKILGTLPGIYYDFDVVSPLENENNYSLANQRQGLYSRYNGVLKKT